jgi:membrane-associated phospholipid phosphatase
VDGLKRFFARARPSDLHHSYSFPSGHTSAAVFIVGALMVVLLPLTAQMLAGGEEGEQQQGGSGRGLLAASTVPDAAVLGICGAAWVTTATGRVLAEAHWVSDTIAGGLLACASVSLLAWASTWMLGASGDGNAAREEQQ